MMALFAMNATPKSHYIHSNQQAFRSLESAHTQGGDTGQSDRYRPKQKLNLRTTSGVLMVLVCNGQVIDPRLPEHPLCIFDENEDDYGVPPISISTNQLNELSRTYEGDSTVYQAHFNSAASSIITFVLK
jgi:hypothetical protein